MWNMLKKEWMPLVRFHRIPNVGCQTWPTRGWHDGKCELGGFIPWIRTINVSSRLFYLSINKCSMCSKFDVYFLTRALTIFGWRMACINQWSRFNLRVICEGSRNVWTQPVRQETEMRTHQPVRRFEVWMFQESHQESREYWNASPSLGPVVKLRTAGIKKKAHLKAQVNTAYIKVWPNSF